MHYFVQMHFYLMNFANRVLRVSLVKLLTSKRQSAEDQVVYSGGGSNTFSASVNFFSTGFDW